MRTWAIVISEVNIKFWFHLRFSLVWATTKERLTTWWWCSTRRTRAWSRSASFSFFSRCRWRDHQEINYTGLLGCTTRWGISLRVVKNSRFIVIRWFLGLWWVCLLKASCHLFLNNVISHVSSNWHSNIAIQSIKVDDGMFFEALLWNSL